MEKFFPYYNEEVKEYFGNLLNGGRCGEIYFFYCESCAEGANNLKILV